MKNKKIKFLTLAMGVLLSSTIVCNATLNLDKNVTKEDQAVMFKEATKQANIGKNYIEHIKITNSKGYIIDQYVDRENYLEQVDEYEKGELLTRKIFYDKGSKVLSIGKDNHEYEGVIMNLDTEISKANKKLFKEISQLESWVKEDLGRYENTVFKKENISDSSIVKYSSKDVNFYFDKDTNFLLKKEELINGEVTQTIEYEKIDKTSKLSKSLFKQESPLIKGYTGYLSSLKVNHINANKEVPLNEAMG